MKNTLTLKAISEILDYEFFIPSYQRGYRWDKQQVEDLLNDIYEFAQMKQKQKLKIGEFYCLQPIVVLEENDTNENNEQKQRYKVIDGQQRITTIFIILKYLENKVKDDFYIDKFYNISYATRNDSEEFLKNKINNGLNKDNPDFYYMSQAYIIIKNWFESNKINKGHFLDVLLSTNYENDKDIANNVRFIWYELDKDEDEIEVFTRLNIGKIPLKNSELIKALFLYEKDENEKREIISMWDYIEKVLQNDRFFYFLTKQEYQNTKIDFIFDLIAKKYNLEYKLDLNTNDERFSFYVFDKLIKEKYKNKKDLWDETKEYFRIFEELYHNNTYYHYVGFYINNRNKNSINEIIKIFKENKKDEFKRKLEVKIQIKLKKELSELNYNEDKNIIEDLLFLFNVIITMKSGYSRYPFNIHNRDKWSLEHIHAQNSEEIKEDKERKTLLQSQKGYVNDELKTKIDTMLKENKIDETKFNKLQNEIFKKFSDEIDVHTIDNLALLSVKDNSALNNNIFPIKRDKIKELDENGKFIPLGTKNVFMKYYSTDVKENISWNKKDREAYFKILEKKLMPFIKVEK